MKKITATTVNYHPQIKPTNYMIMTSQKRKNPRITLKEQQVEKPTSIGYQVYFKFIYKAYMVKKTYQTNTTLDQEKLDIRCLRIWGLTYYGPEALLKVKILQHRLIKSLNL